jgi:NAD(P)-dependent dehydrogenase (short-subunit alcohol dehydrogenase family)
MGRELVVQLARAGANVAACDVNLDTLDRTKSLAEAESSEATISVHRCDVSDEDAVVAFRDEVLGAHRADCVELLFNNAGISGGGSFVNDTRTEWDRTFGVTWGGVYNCARAFMPLLVKSREAVIINTSSVNGFWASLGPNVPHTAYSSAKFAVKGFTEALQIDLRANAPHVRAVLVMPGHIGTDIVRNSFLAHGGTDTATMELFASMFTERAPVSAAQAATVILDAVRAGEWRVLIGDDARRLDEAVRANPVAVYAVDGLDITRA